MSPQTKLSGEGGTDIVADTNVHNYQPALHEIRVLADAVFTSITASDCVIPLSPTVIPAGAIITSGIGIASFQLASGTLECHKTIPVG